MTKKLIVVGAAWCGSCSALKTQLVAKSVEFECIDADEQMEYCQANGVKSLPTSFIIEDNEIVKTILGNKASEIIGGLGDV
ncbi:MAG: thioredoxin family protein [Bacteroidales bacterium]